MTILAVVRSPALRDLVSRAAQHARTAVHACALPAVARTVDDVAGSVLLVHDFAPEPAASVAALERCAGMGGRAAVFALLDAPATPVLDRLAAHPPLFSLAGVALAAEVGPHALAGYLAAARGRHGRRALLALVESCWGLDPGLVRLAERELAGARPHATLTALLRDARMGRKRFARLAHGSHIDPPLRFLHALRVLEAAELLQHGATLDRAARQLGYGSPETLRRHFHEVMRIAPHEARDIPLRELALRCAPSACEP